MLEQKPTGAIAALLDEYRKAINELIVVIRPLTTDQLCKVLHPESSNPDTKSIQSILTHVCASVFSYAVYLEHYIGLDTERPERESYLDVAAYSVRLNEGFNYTQQVFIQHPEIALEELNQNKKIQARWGQQYDVEQMMEHAIVHILRHRRQISMLMQKQNW